MASLRKRGDAWQAEIRRRGHQPVRRSFPTKAMAERWANQVERDIAAGVFVDNSKAESARFADLVERYRTEVVPRMKSARTVQLLCLSLATSFKHETLAGMTADRVMAFMHKRAEAGNNIETARKYLNAISGVFNAAAALWGIPAINPVPVVKKRLQSSRLFDPATKRTRRLTAAEYQAIRAWRPKKKTVAQVFVLFAIETAMRRGEICALDWRDVDLDRQTVTIRESKTDNVTGVKGRTIPLTAHACELLASLEGRAGSVFGLKPASATQAFDRMCKTLKIEGLRLHDLRHEATSRLFERGLSIAEVGAVTGHADWASLKRYTHPDVDELVKKVR